MKKGSRGSCKRYGCRGCGHTFSIDHGRKLPQLWIQHIDGLPFRKIGHLYDRTPMAVYKIVEKEFKDLPNNTQLSKEYCNRWSGILNIDGKYISIRGCPQKFVFIYTVDYSTHDVPVGILASAENIPAFDRLFSLLQDIQYPLEAVVCDDIAALRSAIVWRYPEAKVQLCQTHYLENIRETLQIRTQKNYTGFFNEFLQIFNKEKRIRERLFILETLKNKYRTFDTIIEPLLDEVRNRYNELFAYEKTKALCPHSNNMIECFNSHLNGRLETIKGFESFENAELWLNAWMIRKRTKPFTDCEAPFKHLNGHCGLEMTIAEHKEFPTFQHKKS